MADQPCRLIFLSGVLGMFLPGSSFTRPVFGLMATAFCCVLAAGCQSSPSFTRQDLDQGCVFYLDGAGGGGKVRNYTKGIQQGMIDAGYDGGGKLFVWQTGLGIVADQSASVQYKRKQSRKLAHQIVDYKQRFPHAAVNLVSLSAGTAIAVFALEELPAGMKVDHVVLLASSMSADYDLTKALEHVSHRMYLFMSNHDAVLRFLVPVAGTADRQKWLEAQAAGLRGFVQPDEADDRTVKAYRKLIELEWTPEFADYGHRGGHTDVVKPDFVHAYVAPLIMHKRPRPLRDDPRAAETLVRNPDYDRWQAHEPGAASVFEATQRIDGQRRDVRLTERLVARFHDKIFLERLFESSVDGQPLVPIGRGIFELERIKPQRHPLTHPDAQVDELPAVELTVGDRTFECERKQIAVDATFADWGADINATLFMNQLVPGSIVKINLEGMLEGSEFTFDGKLKRTIQGQTDREGFRAAGTDADDDEVSATSGHMPDDRS
jgi:hypothetical protein